MFRFLANDADHAINHGSKCNLVYFALFKAALQRVHEETRGVTLDRSSSILPEVCLSVSCVWSTLRPCIGICHAVAALIGSCDDVTLLKVSQLM